MKKYMQKNRSAFFQKSMCLFFFHSLRLRCRGSVHNKDHITYWYGHTRYRNLAAAIPLQASVRILHFLKHTVKQLLDMRDVLD